jgi:hypothetical protein
MKIIKYMAVLATFGVLPMSLQAAPLYFNFTGGPTIADTLSFTSGGVTLDVVATTADGSNIMVSQNNNAGVGACMTATDCGRGLSDSPQLDSVGVSDEVLTFNISGGSLILDSFLFGAFNTSNSDRDNFILTVDGVDITGGAFNPGSNPWTVGNDFPNLVATSSFSFRAISAGDEISSFRITELYATENYATALPEPGTLGMLVFGLAAAGLIRRRKSY